MTLAWCVWYLEGAIDLDWSKFFLEPLGVELTPPGSHSLGRMWLNPNLGGYRVGPPKSHIPHVMLASSPDLGGGTHLE